MFLVYSLLFTLGVILTAPYYLWRLRGKILSGAGWRERFGFLPDSFQQSEPGAIWVHAVSVGETLAVVRLVRELRQHYPERKIFMSHATPAGREVGENRLPDLAGRFYLPLDWSWTVRRVLGRLRPGLLLIIETELWPNLLHAAKKFGSRVFLVNARISDRSFRRYRLVRPFMRRVLESVEGVCAQTAGDAGRFRQLGVRPERVVVTGNIKFDAAPPQLGEFPGRLKRVLKGAKRGPVLAAASTMPGEELLLLQAWEQVRHRYSPALLILAPRHPARFGAVAQLLASRGRTFVRRTALEADEDKLAGQLATPEILLLDTIGELAGCLEFADLVLMGGSFVHAGGHNLLEPAFWGKPILFGSHMENFRDVAQVFLEAGAAVEVCDSARLAQAALELLENPTLCRQLGEAARRVLVQGSGATQRALEHMKGCLGVDEPTRAMA